MSNSLLLIISTFRFVYVLSNSQDSIDDHCLTCLCRAATNCNMTYGCIQGYCGPFKISKLYWIDGEREQLPGVISYDTTEVYKNCTNDYACARKTTKNYLLKYKQDCNGDGKIDCDDFSMVNFNGWYQCKTPLNSSDAGIAWLQRYHSCNNVEKEIEVDDNTSRIPLRSSNV